MSREKGARGSSDGVEALLNPKNVVIVGATDRPGNWSQRVWRNLNRYNFPHPIYPFNPGRNVHTIAHQILALHQNVAKVHADAERKRALRICFLDRQRAGNSLHSTGKLYQEAIADGLEQTAGILRDIRIDRVLTK